MKFAMSNGILRAVVALTIAASLSMSGVAHTKNEPRATILQISLHVSACADVPVVMLQRAQREVLWIFLQIGVRVDWVGCGLDRRDPAALLIASPAAISVAVVSRQTKALDAIPPGVLGAVIRDNDGREVGWVLFDRIERASDSFALDTGLILGHAIAHEVGHLLLPR